MGADLLIAHVGFRDGQEPEWDLAKEYVRGLTSEQLANTQERDLFESDDQHRIALLDDLDTLKTAMDDRWREIDWLVVGPYRVWVTGGMSWGDSPTDLFDVISRLSDADVFEPLGSVGFGMDGDSVMAGLIEAAKSVVASWESGDLADAVNALDGALEALGVDTQEA